MSYTFTDGIKDALKGNFSESGEASRRYEICINCPAFNKVVLTCGRCGCFMPAKTKLENATCPDGKW